MDTAQWPQEIVVKPMEEIIVPNTCSSSVTTTTTNNNSSNNNNNNKIICSTALERKVRPQKDQAVNCPRCNSTNTKFCYYNNYSLTQPRYFCKTCRRYWTEGGSLRNIPVGGGSRKNNKRSSFSSSNNNISSNSSSISSSSTCSASIKKLIFNPNPIPNTNPNHNNQDLNLGFPTNHQDQFRSLSEFIQLPTIETTQKTNNGTNNNNNVSALELLNGFTACSSSNGLTPFMPIPDPDPNGAHHHHHHHHDVYSSSGFTLHDFKPTLSFSLDNIGYGSCLQQQESNNNNGGRILFPFEDLKQVTSPHHNSTTTTTNDDQQTRDHHDHQQGDSSHGYWTGMLGNGGSW